MKTFSALIISIFFISCGASSGKKVNEDQEPVRSDTKTIIKNKPVPLKSNLNCPNGTSLSYDNFGAGVFINYCTTCHTKSLTAADRLGTPEGMDFDTQVNIQVWRANILKSVMKEKSMPPNNDIPQAQFDFLKEWLECGAP